MASLREIALTIEEREEGRFYWVLLIEAFDEEGSEILQYRHLASAPEPQESYSNALALGVTALRRLAKEQQSPGPR